MGCGVGVGRGSLDRLKIPHPALVILISENYERM